MAQERRSDHGVRFDPVEMGRFRDGTATRALLSALATELRCRAASVLPPHTLRFCSTPQAKDVSEGPRCSTGESECERYLADWSGAGHGSGNGRLGLSHKS